MSSSRHQVIKARSRSRRFLIQALYQWQVGGDDPGDVIVQFIDIRNMGSADQDYFCQVMRAIPADVEALDALIAPYLERSVALIDPVERAILRLACYELRDCWETPHRVVLNEAIDLARAFGAEQGHRFINGVVDRLARELRPHECDKAGHQPGSTAN